MKDEVVVRELDDAIVYHKEIAEGGQGEVCLDESMRKQIWMDHLQTSLWLTELQRYKNLCEVLRMTVSELAQELDESDELPIAYVEAKLDVVSGILETLKGDVDAANES